MRGLHHPNHHRRKGEPDSTPHSIRRIVKNITTRNGSRNRTAYTRAAIIHLVLPNAIQQPVIALRAVNQRLPSKRVGGHALEIFWHKLLQTRRSTPVLGLVTAQGEFSDEQAEVGGDPFVPYFGPLSCTPALPSGHSPCDMIEP